MMNSRSGSKLKLARSAIELGGSVGQLMGPGDSGMSPLIVEW